MDINNEDKKKLFSFFSNIKKEMNDTHLNWKDKTNNHILLIDGTNLFIRSWCAVNTLNSNGDHFGGVTASLKSLGAAIKLLNPSRCLISFDGVGGSAKRKAIYPEYKAHRSTKIRLNRVYEENSTPQNEQEQMEHEYLAFVNYLQTLPISIISINMVESDDVLAWLALEHFKTSKKVTIMSTDRDFLQLCDANRIQVYSPTKKIIYNANTVINEYGISPSNFCLLKSLIGDDGDNIPGIERAGLKTICKHFPYLKEEKIHTIDEIIIHATDMRNKFVVCENIASNKSIIERNYDLMQLKETSLGTTSQLHLQDVLQEKKIPMLDRNAFYKLIRNDHLENNIPDYLKWVSECFDYLNGQVRNGE